jgi:hypothetical protein
MTFASAEVRNKPLPAPLRFLSRDAAEACEVFIDFWTWGPEDGRVRVSPTITGRWDSHREPLRYRPVPLPGALPDPGGAVPQAVQVAYDPALDTAEHEVAVGSDRGHFSVAILRDGQAFAFANESYAHLPDHLGQPEWQLAQNQTYRVEVRVKGSNVDHRQVFKLEFYSDDFAHFRLQPVTARRAFPRQTGAIGS